MTRIWFTADLHLGHDSAWVRESRPCFADADAGVSAMMGNWNAAVSRGDLVYVLGDFCWWKDRSTIERTLAGLHGNKILIAGNHDWKAVRTAKGWASVHPLLTIRPRLRETAYRITLCHYPMRSWPASHHGSWHLHGHSHCQGEPYPGALDVGVEGHWYTPWSLQEVVDYFKGQEDFPG